MLGIHGIGRDRARYYLSDLARELPVSEPGRWVGTAAAGLGLEGPLDEAAFERMLHGRHPATDRTMGSGRTTVTAFDLTFSAPKSASVVFALGGDAATRHVVAAHGEAVAGALTYLERHGVTAVRRSGPESAVLATEGIVGGQFTHAVNRNGDPHLHSHVVMANLVHGVDGRWSACDWRGLDAHRRAASAVYDAQLRAGLVSALGVRWSGPPGRSVEIVGVGPELLGEFSSRGADIRRHIHEVGVRSRRAALVAWAVTRPAKPPGVAHHDAVAEWEHRARAAGGPPELAVGERRPRSVAAGGQQLDEHRYASVIAQGTPGGARRRDVVAAFCAAAADGIAAPALERLVDHWVPPGPPGVAEPLHQRRAVVPANHLLRALGPRPLDPGDHELWVGAACALDAYRCRWGLARSPEPLGADSPASLASLSGAQLADHVRTARQLEAVRARLGRRQPPGVELALAR